MSNRTLQKLLLWFKFRNYYRDRFCFWPFHQHMGKKIYHSRLKRRVDCLLPFKFTMKFLAGKEMRFTDSISRIPSGIVIKSFIQRILLNYTATLLVQVWKPAKRKLRNNLKVSILNFIFLSPLVCNLSHNQTEHCIPSDLSKIDHSNFLFFFRIFILLIS